LPNTNSKSQKIIKYEYVNKLTKFRLTTYNRKKNSVYVSVSKTLKTPKLLIEYAVDQIQYVNLNRINNA
jgi:hypothetical protein